MIVDTHQHFWDLDREPMPWLRPEHAAIAHSFGPDDLRPLLDACGVDATILVQAACTDTDTDAMLAQATAHPWIVAVTAWVDLVSARRTRDRLDALSAEPKLRAVRHLIHDESDPHWILQDSVLESLVIVEERGLLLELPCVFPRHLGDVPELALSFPRLTLVIDHLGKPPLGTGSMGKWEALIRRAAGFENVVAKVSGLNTMLASPDWSAADLRRAVDVAYECFGADRLVCGSDWPVSELNGTYPKVWYETVAAVSTVAGDAATHRILEDTPARLYRLGDHHGAASAVDSGEAHGCAH